ncbi:MAG: hypothetical protein MnENMB40S_38470 [Rhizobiaceae bacterium MnEN-MB40S]|nr:MAG: hypothetical protein MnENMB40S_38470 [Rhizobiaceae bacterium MnEN-MB40S]
MHMITTLPMRAAEIIVDEAISQAKEHNLHPLTIVVLDAGGRIVAVKSQDGSGIMRFDVAFGKAWGALGMGISSRQIRDRLINRPVFQTALASASDGRLIPVPGGVLIENEKGETIGSVGVSGDTSEKDELCAIKGIHKAGYRSEPADIDPDWTRSYLSDQEKAKA